MYEGLVNSLRTDHDKYFARDMEAADAIEKLNSQVESLCETIDLYHKLLGGHPDPRGEDGEPGIKCIPAEEGE